MSSVGSSHSGNAARHQDQAFSDMHWGERPAGGREDQVNPQNDNFNRTHGGENPSVSGAGARFAVPLSAAARVGTAVAASPPQPPVLGEAVGAKLRRMTPSLYLETGNKEGRVGLAAPFYRNSPFAFDVALSARQPNPPTVASQQFVSAPPATTKPTVWGYVRERLSGNTPSCGQLTARSAWVGSGSPVSVRTLRRLDVERSNPLASGAKTGSHAAVRHQPGRENQHPWVTKYEDNHEHSLICDFVGLLTTCLPKRWVPSNKLTYGFKFRRITEVTESLNAQEHAQRCRDDHNSRCPSQNHEARWTDDLRAFWRRWMRADDSHDLRGRIQFWPHRFFNIFKAGHNARAGAHPNRLFEPKPGQRMRFETQVAEPWSLRLWIGIAKQKLLDLSIYLAAHFNLSLPTSNVEIVPELTGHRTLMRIGTFEDVRTERRRGLQVEGRVEQIEETSGGLANQVFSGAMALSGRGKTRQIRGFYCKSHFAESRLADEQARRSNPEFVAALIAPEDPLRLPAALVATALDVHSAAAWLQTLKDAHHPHSLTQAASRMDEAASAYSAVEYEQYGDISSVMRDWAQTNKPRCTVVVREESRVNLDPAHSARNACVGEETQVTRRTHYERLALPGEHNTVLSVRANWAPPEGRGKILEHVTIDLDLKFNDSQSHETINELLAKYPPFYADSAFADATSTWLPKLPLGVPVGERVIGLTLRLDAAAYDQLCQRMADSHAGLHTLTPEQRTELTSASPDQKFLAFARYICHSQAPEVVLGHLAKIHEGPFFTLSGKSKAGSLFAMTSEFYTFYNALMGTPPSLDDDAFDELVKCADCIETLQKKTIAAHTALEFDCYLTPAQAQAAADGFNVLREDLNDCLNERMKQFPGSYPALLQAILACPTTTSALGLMVQNLFVHAPQVVSQASAHASNDGRERLRAYREEIRNVQRSKLAPYTDRNPMASSSRLRSSASESALRTSMTPLSERLSRSNDT